MLNLTARLINREIEFYKKRDKARRDLLKCPEFNKHEGFKALSGGKEVADVKSMIEFFDANGYYASRDDLEAILRRMDHDADQALS